MQSFLEFLCHLEMGPPVSGSCWHCPFCDSPHGSFSVRPPKPGYRVRFKCHRCEALGDEHDIFKLFHPLWGYALRCLKLEELRREFEANHPTNSFRGEGTGGTVSQKRETDPCRGPCVCRSA